MISLHRDTRNFGDESRYYKDFEPVDFGDDLASIARVISTYVWSPNQWLDGGRRREASWTRALYCVLDFDDGDVTIEQAKRTFADCIHIIGTTRSHQKPKGDFPACDRFRVVLKFERPIENLREFRASMGYWIGRFGSDSQCIDGARFYWPCEKIISICGDGDTVEVVEPPPPAPTPDYSAYRLEKAIPAWARGVLLLGAPRGRRNSTCYRLGVYLSQCGFCTEEILHLISHSPIDLPDDEAARAVTNGAKLGRQIMAEQHG